jgi:hypothetical protein
MKQAVGEMQVAIFIEAKKMAPHEFPKLTGIPLLSIWP